MVIEAFNDGFTTVSDQLIVTGNITFGGALVIGFVTNSLGLVTADFSPFTLNTASGAFDQVVDAGGNIINISFSGGVFTILGVRPTIPDEVINDILGDINNKEAVNEAIEDNTSQAEEMMEAILEEEDDEGSQLVCK
jgi:hypothetical protein